MKSAKTWPLASAFQSTLPAGGATFWMEIQPAGLWDFNPRSPRGERPDLTNATAATINISIHAPRGGSDTKMPEKISTKRHFNPRSPRGERPTDSLLAVGVVREFQSTLPAGGATPRSSAAINPQNDFNPRSPRGERPRLKLCEEASDCISIHAPRGGSDKLSEFTTIRTCGFQSTLPAGGATPKALTL